MKEHITPKQAARAMGVSESSLKRWCDQGLVPSSRTGGGHRRLPVSGFLSFIRESGHELEHPELLGLPGRVGRGERGIQRAADLLRDALIAGDEQRCRQIVFELYIAGHPLGVICDEVLARAFHEIGDRWTCGEVEVYQERHGCEICLRLLHELRSTLPEPPADAPLAIGGGAEGDRYSLATTMVELVLRAQDWRAISLGFGLPFESLIAALRAHRPRVFWLSVSHLDDEAAFVAGCNQLFSATKAAGVPLLVGGRALTPEIRKQIGYTLYCDDLRHLESFLASGMKPPAESETSS